MSSYRFRTPPIQGQEDISMKMTVAIPRQRLFQLLAPVALCALAALPLAAQSPSSEIQAAIQAPLQPRIQAEVDGNALSVIPGSKHPLAQAGFDAGRVPAATKLTGITIFFNHSPEQEAELQALLKAQQDPSSPEYHQWLTPDEFAARFGMAQADLDKVQTWLESEGFSIDSVNRSRNAIHFSGNVAQVERSFATEMHYYNVGGVKHFAPSTALSVPAAIAPVVANIADLHDFKPRPMHIRSKKVSRARPGYTYAGNDTEGVFFAPGDIKVAYDINSLIGAGNNGAGQTIAIMGQSAIQTVDIENFQQAASLTVKDPTLTLVPSTGASTVEADGDEGESDLDVEWSGAIATGASINFVYTGDSSNNNGVFDSYTYAVDEKIGNIISISYGSCEPALGQSYFNQYELVGEQAAAQGQSVFAASGDQGATGCYGYPTTGSGALTTTQTESVAVNYPASSAYVTGVGGTESSADDVTYGKTGFSTYWENVSTSSSNIYLTSLLTYIPEIAWNDNVLSATSGCEDVAEGEYECLSASGGGVSTLAAQPSWQTSYFTTTGETNPSSSHRLVPDVALYASPNYPGYLFCTSDSSDWFAGGIIDGEDYPPQTASCGDSQFYDPVNEYFTAAGGTSFASPIFAGMTAILNQAKGYVTGQGLINTELYKLAAVSANVSPAADGQGSAAFHDVTSGNNECTYGLSDCGVNSSGYSAGTGYDEVTGLGSVDLGNLVTAWSTPTSTLVGTTTSISASNAAPAVGASVTFTITVAGISGAGTPGGTVNLSIDGGGTSYSDGGTTASVTLAANGTATYATSFSTAGTHSIVAQYAGNSTYGFSTGTGSVAVAGTSSGSGTFTMAFSPTTLTVSQGSEGTEALTVTPSGYTGTVEFSYDTSNDTALENLCVFSSTGFTSSGALVVSSATTAVTGQITIDTDADDCANDDSIAAFRARGLYLIPHAGKALKTTARAERNPAPLGLALAGLLLAGFLGRSSRKLRGLACVVALAAIGLAMTACGGGGGGGGGTTVPDPAKGTYTITFTGQDSVTTTITAPASFTLTID
jgi:subtilase family serine protease